MTFHQKLGQLIRDRYLKPHFDAFIDGDSLIETAKLAAEQMVCGGARDQKLLLVSLVIKPEQLEAPIEFV